MTARHHLEGDVGENGAIAYSFATQSCFTSIRLGRGQLRDRDFGFPRRQQAIELIICSLTLDGIAPRRQDLLDGLEGLSGQERGGKHRSR